MPKKDQMYSLRVEMAAEAEPLELTLDDLAQDQLAQMEKLIEDLEDVDPEEAADEVYEEYLFTVCTRCRREMHRGFKDKARSKK